jgi:hypothetical protein
MPEVSHNSLSPEEMLSLPEHFRLLVIASPQNIALMKRHLDPQTGQDRIIWKPNLESGRSALGDKNVTSPDPFHLIVIIDSHAPLNEIVDQPPIPEASIPLITDITMGNTKILPECPIIYYVPDRTEAIKRLKDAGVDVKKLTIVEQTETTMQDPTTPMQRLSQALARATTPAVKETQRIGEVIY